MTKTAQNLLLVLVGSAALWITVATDEYLNYVKPGFRFLLIAAAVAVLALGAVGLRKEWRDTGGHDGHDESRGDGHDHGRGPRVAWLLCLPALVIFVIAPPALGSFSASRDNARSAPPASPPAEGFGALKTTTGGAPVEMTVGEFIGRSFEAQTGDPSRLQGYPIKLTGFVTPRKKGDWYLTRMRIACCAGDAIALQVIVHDAATPPTDSWVQVVGTWRAPSAETAATGVHELSAASVRPIKKPRNPYER